MVEIRLSPEQAAVLRNADSEVMLRDETGRCVAMAERLEVSPDITDEDIQVFARYRKQRGKPQKLYTTAEVLAYIESIAPK